MSAAVIPTPYHPSAKRTILVGALVFAMSTLPGLAHSLWSNHDASAKTDVSIAQALPDYGVHAGDLVASVGTGEGAYWARLSRVSIVAETWDENTDGFFDLPRSSQETLLRKMSAAGARAVIWHVPPNP